MMNLKLNINQMQTKDDKGKLFYELDWSFVEKMAERMSMNKNKYEPFNWQKGENISGINQAIARHFIEIQKGNYSDDQKFGHYIALAVNAMIAVYQLEQIEIRELLQQMKDTPITFVDDSLESKITNLVKENPNDQILGFAIRELVK